MPSDVRSPVSGAEQTAQDTKGCGIRTHVCCQSASRQVPQEKEKVYSPCVAVALLCEEVVIRGSMSEPGR